MEITVKESKKLLPCPFCGSTDLETVPFYEECVVHCRGCQVDGPEGDMPTCERLWNERSPECN